MVSLRLRETLSKTCTCIHVSTHTYTHKEQAAGEGRDELKAGTRVTWLAMTHREMVIGSAWCFPPALESITRCPGSWGTQQLNKGNTYRYWNPGCLVIHGVEGLAGLRRNVLESTNSGSLRSETVTHSPHTAGSPMQRHPPPTHRTGLNRPALWTLSTQSAAPSQRPVSSAPLLPVVPRR